MSTVRSTSSSTYSFRSARISSGWQWLARWVLVESSPRVPLSLLLPPPLLNSSIGLPCECVAVAHFYFLTAWGRRGKRPFETGGVSEEDG